MLGDVFSLLRLIDVHNEHNALIKYFTERERRKWVRLLAKESHLMMFYWYLHYSEVLPNDVDLNNTADKED